MSGTAPSRPLRIAIIAGEESGDVLAAHLMEALNRRGPVSFVGIGGHRMEQQGLKSIFPMSDIAINGGVAIARNLPMLLRRIREAAIGVIATEPDVLVIVDSPEFTHRVARKVRKANPEIPIINYVPPTVWAWRPGRARAMRAYVDRSMAVLPFEPAEHAKLGGPPCDYIGHPVSEIIATKTRAPEAPADPPVLLVLPGSRRTEIERLMALFGNVVGRVHRPGMRIVIPAVRHLEAQIAEKAALWPVKPEIVAGEAAKWEAFSRGTAALAASGTVTLELALMGVPQVVGYRIEWLAAALMPFFRAHSIAMANLVHGSRIVPEFLHKECTEENLAGALAPLLSDTPERRRQIEGIAAIRRRMEDEAATPADHAADIVLETVAARVPGGRS
ncbi:MAG: lipid-A-disaccharide synthase [Flavobacteriaceae bacterium]